MPIWSQDPPTDPRGPALPIRRTPAGRPLLAIVTSENLIGCYTHFHKGKTVPCEGRAFTDAAGPHPTHCEACHDGIPYRWHSYLSAVDQKDGLHIIFECTAQATEAFTTYRDHHHTVRGCLFEACRLNARPNGRVIIRCKPADLTKHRLPHGPDLTQCMAIIWSLPIDAVDTQRTDPERKVPLAEAIPRLAELHGERNLTPELHHLQSVRDDTREQTKLRRAQ